MAKTGLLQPHILRATHNTFDDLRVISFRRGLPKRELQKLNIQKHYLQHRIGLNSTMSAATANNGDDDFRTRAQQPMLASQRAKQDNAPSEANRTGKVGGYFPLGYKDAISQWVGDHAFRNCSYADSSSGQISQQLKLSTRSCLSYLILRNPQRRPRPGRSPPLRHLQPPPRRPLTARKR